MGTLNPTNSTQPRPRDFAATCEDLQNADVRCPRRLCRSAPAAAEVCGHRVRRAANEREKIFYARLLTVEIGPTGKSEPKALVDGRV